MLIHTSFIYFIIIYKELFWRQLFKTIPSQFIRTICSQNIWIAIHIYERCICHDFYRPTCDSVNSRFYSTINLCTGMTKLDAADYTTRLATLRGGQIGAYTLAWACLVTILLPQHVTNSERRVKLLICTTTWVMYTAKLLFK
jgi:hypothetical protein